MIPPSTCPYDGKLAIREVVFIDHGAASLRSKSLEEKGSNNGSLDNSSVSILNRETIKKLLLV